MDDVEKVARAMAEAVGYDPDQMVPETGYSNAPLVPAWTKQNEWAARFLAGTRAMAAAQNPT